MSPEGMTEETELLAAVQRALATPRGKFAVRVAFSRFEAPLPRSHHRRIARVILDQVAQQHDGELFEPGCGDLVTICNALKQHSGDPALHPAALAHTFSRLFRLDVPPGVSVVDIWEFERDGATALAYAMQLVH